METTPMSGAGNAMSDDESVAGISNVPSLLNAVSKTAISEKSDSERTEIFFDVAATRISGRRRMPQTVSPKPTEASSWFAVRSHR